MTIGYFDSSAFVKLVIEEPGSELAADLWDGCDLVVSSRIAYSEVRAALAAAGRARRLEPAEQRQAEAQWESLWSVTRTVELTQTLAADAGRLASRHALRGADAVHLACVLGLQPVDLLFAAWDRRLRDGAAAEGVPLAPATL